MHAVTADLKIFHCYCFCLPQVLSFDAFFQEAVHEKREEQFRVRNCKIYFYLEDDSIQVIEQRAKNAGIPQGLVIFVDSFHKQTII